MTDPGKKTREIAAIYGRATHSLDCTHISL